MMLKTINTKAILSGLAVFAISCGFAQNDVTQTKEKNYRQCESCQPAKICEPCPCEKIVEQPLMCAYNAPATTIVKCPIDAYVSASFIYWQAKEKGLDLGTTNNECDPCCPGKVINMDFDFKPGFKVGLGMHAAHDDWNLFIEYTRLHLTDTASYKLNNECGDCDLTEVECPPCENINASLTTKLFGPDLAVLYYNKAHGKWTMNLDLIDFELSRAYWVGTQLTFAPFVGLRGGWIDQKMTATYNAINVFPFEQVECQDSCTTYGSNLKSDSWLIGPRVGIDTNWLLGAGFRIFGNTAFSLLYQDFKTKNNESYCEDLCLPVGACAKPCCTEHCGDNNLNDHNSYLTPNAEIGLGLGYGRQLNCYKWFFDLTVGYEFHAFWNQNFMRNIWDKGNEYDPNLDTDTGDLFLHGLTITAKLDF